MMGGGRASSLSLPMFLHKTTCLWGPKPRESHHLFVCVLLCLASLTEHHVFGVQPHCRVCYSFTPFHG